jgi:hypothetical protein
MGDASKSKINTRTSTRGSSTNSLAPGNRAFSPRPDLDSQIAASAGPVTSDKEARSWLEKKGWILTSESYSKSKLAEILFSVALSFKLPPEADAAVRSVAFLIRDQGEEDFASSVSTKLIDKIASSLCKPIENLSDSVASAKSFLSATSQQHASALISLQETVKQQSDHTHQQSMGALWSTP